MRRTASEILADFDARIARLERQAYEEYEPDYDFVEEYRKELDPAQALSDLQRKVGRVKVLHKSEMKHYIEFYVWAQSTTKLYRVDGLGGVTLASEWKKVR